MKLSHAVLGLSLVLPSVAPAGQAIRSVRFATGFSAPIFVTHSPNDYTRLFVVQQGGQIRIRTGGATLGTPFLNVGPGGSNIIVSGGEQGLLGLAFHPQYQTNGTFYIYYTASGGGANTLARYSVSGNPNVASPVGTVLFSVADPFANHNGGWIGFGPDGYLYIAMGDGGSGGDPNNAGQNPNTMLGKMHRIDVDGADGLPGNDDDDGILGNGIAGYSSPPDNPFVPAAEGVCTGAGANVGNRCNEPGDCPGGACTPGRDEIWAYGLRNHWRNSFDRLTGDLYIADVGQGAWEEIDFQPAGAAGGVNYGWRCMEGNHCTGSSGCICNSPAITDPIHEFSHGAGNCSVTGGYVYRGCAIPDLQGVYFFADYCSNQIWSFRYTGSVTEFTNRTAELVPDVGSITDIVSFGEDAYGELYIVDHAGEIFKIMPDVSPVDCNGNAQGDACDILSGASPDSNSNGIPDECEVAPPPAPMADPSGINKSRSVSVSVPAATVAAGPAGVTALRVTLTSLHHPVPPYNGGQAADFSAFEGDTRWVGPPSNFVESSSDPTPLAASVLQCDPHYQDWSTVGLLHIIGREVVPSSIYTVANVHEACAGHEDTCIIISSGLEIDTTRWADIQIPYNPPSTTDQPDVGDISALVNKFRSAPGAISKIQAAISGEIPDLGPDISFTHISACVDAFRGFPYPHGGPTNCP